MNRDVIMKKKKIFLCRVPSKSEEYDYAFRNSKRKNAHPDLAQRRFKRVRQFRGMVARAECVVDEASKPCQLIELLFTDTMVLKCRGGVGIVEGFMLSKGSINQVCRFVYHLRAKRVRSISLR